jgi:hypothetical protein
MHFGWLIFLEALFLSENKKTDSVKESGYPLPVICEQHPPPRLCERSEAI